MDAIFWIFGALIIFGIVGGILKPSRCDICNVTFKRKYHTWEIGGEKQHLCPSCNGRMTRKISKERFNQRFGD